MKQLKIFGVMALLIIGIMLLISSWYLIVAVMALFITYYASKAFVTVRGIWYG